MNSSKYMDSSFMSSCQLVNLDEFTKFIHILSSIIFLIIIFECFLAFFILFIKLCICHTARTPRRMTKVQWADIKVEKLRASAMSCCREGSFA